MVLAPDDHLHINQSRTSGNDAVCADRLVQMPWKKSGQRSACNRNGGYLRAGCRPTRVTERNSTPGAMPGRSPNRARALCLSFPGKGDHRTPSPGLAQPRHTRPAGLFASRRSSGRRHSVPPSESASPSSCGRQNRAVIRAAVGDLLATLSAWPPGRASSTRKLVRHCRAHAGSAWARPVLTSFLTRCGR